MLDKEFYGTLDYDFSVYEEDEALYGLTPIGFSNNYKPLDLREFDTLKLNAARDMLSCYLSQTRAFNKRITSYGLKHIIENALAVESGRQIDYISNGTLILAMYDYGFKIKRINIDSPNCYFNVSTKSVNDIIRYINLHQKSKTLYI